MLLFLWKHCRHHRKEPPYGGSLNDIFYLPATERPRKDPEEERFYEIFFRLCQKYGVRWASATPKEQRFIEEVTRVTYERDRALRLGLPLSAVRPSFAS